MSTTTQYEVGTIVHVAPGELLMERNIREATPDKALIQSVREVGVLEPITAVLTDAGGLLVRYGHRRALAAIEAERETVPVYVAGADSTDTPDEIHRIITQRDENTHRSGLTTAEDVASVEQLAAFGLSAAQITKQARIKRTDVDAALTVAGSKIARKAAERYTDLTLDQAATVADFEDDPEAVKALVVAAVDGQFDHVAQRARDDRGEAQAKAELLATLETEGVTVIQRPFHDDKTTQRLDRLRPEAGSRQALKVEDHKTCPGHVAWLGLDWIYIDSTGTPVVFPDEPAEDATEEARQAHKDEYRRIRNASREVQWPAPVFGCRGWRKHGHVDPNGATSTKAKPDEMTEHERENAKAERRLVIENNKAWAAAEPVRREFVATLTKAKTPPKGTARFLAIALCKDSTVTGSVAGNKMAAEWLGVRHVGYGMADLSPAKTATDNRALVLALVQTLGGYEADLTKDSWRRDGTHNAVGRYLRFIEACGYTLSEVEKYAASKKTA